MTFDAARFRQLLAFEEREARLLSCETDQMDGYVVEHLRLAIDDTEVRGILTRPAAASGKLPAILYGHSHGGRHDIGARELLDGREYLLDPLGPVLAKAGYITLSIDMPVFGERSSVSESFAAKALLWEGKSLFGQMLSDHAAALTYLTGRDDVDADRVGAFGISMGCFLSYWLAAMDERIKAVAHLCCFADLRTLIAMGGHDRHGIYLVVPGLLAEADGGTIAGLIAPRPQLICVGEADRLTPMPAVEKALAELKPAYAGIEDRFAFLSAPDVGHQETAEMRHAMLAFFGKWLS